MQKGLPSIHRSRYQGTDEPEPSKYFHREVVKLFVLPIILKLIFFCLYFVFLNIFVAVLFSSSFVIFSFYKVHTMIICIFLRGWKYQLAGLSGSNSFSLA